MPNPIDIKLSEGLLGFFGATPVARQTVTDPAAVTSTVTGLYTNTSTVSGLYVNSCTTEAVINSMSISPTTYTADQIIALRSEVAKHGTDLIAVRAAVSAAATDLIAVRSAISAGATDITALRTKLASAIDALQTLGLT